MTDAPTLEYVIDVMGSLRIAIKARLSMDMAASPIQGACLRVTGGDLVTARSIGVAKGIDRHHTGEVHRIDRRGISRLLNEHNIALFSSLGYSPIKGASNLVYEDIATRAAINLETGKSVLYGAGRGLPNASGRLARELRLQQVSAHLQRLSNSYQAELLDTAAQACWVGVKRSHIISYTGDGTLLSELFTRTGSGTLVVQEQSEQLCEASVKNIGGLIELVRPLKEQGILARRSREVLRREIKQFSIVEHEGLIIAYAALYPIAGSGTNELACLAVSPEHCHGGRGDELLEQVEKYTREFSLKILFVLTMRTAYWFRERGFQSNDVERLPMARTLLYDSQRDLQVLEKSL